MASTYSNFTTVPEASFFYKSLVMQRGGDSRNSRIKIYFMNIIDPEANVFLCKPVLLVNCGTPNDLLFKW